jgi:6-phosphogluconolactonase (cycloisomerase 2 family)
MSACGGGTIAYMWVVGQQYSQITGFKVDDYTGNLTQAPGTPYTSGGVNPVSILVKPGGRYVYVINQGVGGGPNTPETSGGIAVFAVGGDGVLTYQQTYQSQGYVPVWAQFDNTGSFLYVLDRYAPDGVGAVGSITAFAVDSSTGRLQLQTNAQNKTGPNGTNISYFPVGPSPIMAKSLGSCLLTLDSNRTVFPYSFAGNGQLNLTTNGSQVITGSTLSSINGNGGSVYITDSGANAILSFQVGSACNLTSSGGGTTANIAGTSNPQYSLIDNSGKYLYVLNQSTTSTTTGTPFSSISAFTINQSTQQLQQIAGSPYPVGSNPVCMVEDPTSQYIYVSNRNDGTVSGKVIDSTTGELSNLSRGSTFTASGLGGCLVISGAVN